MAKLNFQNLGFQPSPGAVDHRLRMFPEGATPSANEVYAAPFGAVGVDGVIDSAEIAGLGGANIEGKFDLYLTAVDQVGNESDFSVKRNFPLDLVAPPAPEWL